MCERRPPYVEAISTFWNEFESSLDSKGVLAPLALKCAKQPLGRSVSVCVWWVLTREHYRSAVVVFVVLCRINRK